MSFNATITAVINEIGYPITGEGSCSGFAVARVVARKNGIADIFTERCRIIAETPRNEIINGIKVAREKVKTKQELTVSDMGSIYDTAIPKPT